MTNLELKKSALKDLIDVSQDALDKSAISAAFFCSLSIPDLCSQIESGVLEGDRDHYIEWYDEFVLKYKEFESKDENSNLLDENPFEKIDGSIVYILRCKLFHECDFYPVKIIKKIKEKFKVESERELVISFNYTSKIDGCEVFTKSWEPKKKYICIHVNQEEFTKKMIVMAKSYI